MQSFIANKYLWVKIQVVFLEDFIRKLCLQNLVHLPFIYYGVHWQIQRFIVFVHGWYTDGAFLRGAFFRSLHLSWSCRKRVLLKHPSDRGRRPFTSLGHGRRVIRVQRAMRCIFDVKVLFPRLVCSASKFQTSCLWNLTRASHAKVAARASYSRLHGNGACECIYRQI